ncbi:hypothetical protein HDA43_006924 [Streptosporangium sandarakinum]|uniref:Uncharacterized protein n=1 Tax=Streptosporangium sandarakinum TaxID=1260955 RepID=A0A852V4M7_9ACTN|nr:hypothetical protein [Streptosporangium sandarakinum]
MSLHYARMVIELSSHKGAMLSSIALIPEPHLAATLR